MKLWVICATLTRTTGTVTTHRSVAGWRIIESRDEAIGLFVMHMLDTNKGFSISEISVMQVPSKEIFSLYNSYGGQSDYKGAGDAIESS